MPRRRIVTANRSGPAASSGPRNRGRRNRDVHVLMRGGGRSRSGTGCGRAETSHFTLTRLSRYVIVPSLAPNHGAAPDGTTITSPFAPVLVTPSSIALLRPTSGSVDGASGILSAPPVTSVPLPSTT